MAIFHLISRQNTHVEHICKIINCKYILLINCIDLTSVVTNRMCCLMDSLSAVLFRWLPVSCLAYILIEAMWLVDHPSVPAQAGLASWRCLLCPSSVVRNGNMQSWNNWVKCLQIELAVCKEVFKHLKTYIFNTILGILEEWSNYFRHSNVWIPFVIFKTIVYTFKTCLQPFKSEF